jgi:hypothetical protein
MEPIVTLSYILASFFGYYVGSDIWNYYTSRSEFDNIKNRLDKIQTDINSIKEV